MKKYGIAAAVLAVVVAGFFAWRWINGRDDSMASSLPAELTMVGRYNLKSLALDYGMSSSDLQSLMTKVGNGKDTGVKYQSTGYIFGMDGYFGVIVPLSDDDDFVAMLREDGLNMDEQRGLQWCVVDGNFLMAISDDRAMMMGPAVGSEQDQLRNRLYEYIKQSESKSGKQSRLYQLLDDRKEPVAMVGGMDALPTDLLKNKYIKSFDGINLTAGLTAKKEGLSVSFMLDTESKSVSKLLDEIDDVFDKIDGSLVRTTPKKAVFNMTANVDGEDLLKLLRKNNALRIGLLGLNMIFDLDKVVKSIDGDVSLTCPAYSGGTPKLLFQAELDDDKFMKSVRDWNDATTRAMGISFYSQDKNNAMCSVSGLPIYFGTQSKCLRISNDEAMMKSDAYEDLMESYVSEMKGNRIYASLQLSNLGDAMGQTDFDGEAFFDLFDRLTLSMPNSRELRLNLVTREGVDILEHLMDKTTK